ncbi:endonuclease V [Flavobacterium oreochromis]|uniref:endonuclease V n=1 Tax=Flavobacterium oreochromis TaxID=2906078 RepID=UPI003859FF88
MNLAIDVYYPTNQAKAVGVLFNWEDEKPTKIIIETIQDVQEYEPGQFYKRELPCILTLLKQVDLFQIDTIIVDGHVYVNNDKSFGLGGHLFQSLEEKIPVIGVAKKSFIHTDKVSFPIFRGESKNPLYISSIGINVEYAIEKVQNMRGNYRIPSIFKELDQITKSE